MKKKALRQCYIERLLYDIIYEHTLHKQNLGHLLELQQVTRLYQDYFKGFKISIDVSYREVYTPSKVIIRTDHYGLNYSLEEFEKKTDGTGFQTYIDYSSHTRHSSKIANPIQIPKLAASI